MDCGHVRERREENGPREGKKKRRVGRRERNRPKGKREFLLFFFCKLKLNLLNSNKFESNSNHTIK
jgi:hypothetical protein